MKYRIFYLNSRQSAHNADRASDEPTLPVVLHALFLQLPRQEINHLRPQRREPQPGLQALDTTTIATPAPPSTSGRLRPPVVFCAALLWATTVAVVVACTDAAVATRCKLRTRLRLHDERCRGLNAVGKTKHKERKNTRHCSAHVCGVVTEIDHRALCTCDGGSPAPGEKIVASGVYIVFYGCVYVFFFVILSPLLRKLFCWSDRALWADTHHQKSRNNFLVISPMVHEGD